MTEIAIIDRTEITEAEVINRFQRYYRAGDLIHFSCSFNENTAGDVSIIDAMQHAIDKCTDPPIELQIRCPVDADYRWLRSIAQEIDAIFNSDFVLCYRKPTNTKTIFLIIVQ